MNLSSILSRPSKFILTSAAIGSDVYISLPVGPICSKVGLRKFMIYSMVLCWGEREDESHCARGGLAVSASWRDFVRRGSGFYKSELIERLLNFYEALTLKSRFGLTSVGATWILFKDLS